MAQFDRFDICEAHLLLEWDYNVSGWIQDRPSNVRRNESTGVQLGRMQFRPAMGLSFDELTDNGKEIYLDNVVKWNLPIDEEQKQRLEAMFIPEYLQKARPDIFNPLSQ